MKVGDMVRLAIPVSGEKGPLNTGVVLKIFKKKCWRTGELGHKINWDLIEPEPHAEVLINEDILNIPAIELEVVNDRNS